MLARKSQEDSLQSGRKNPLNKNQGWEPVHQKYKAMRTQVDTTQRKKKSKQSIKIKYRPMQIGLMGTK